MEIAEVIRGIDRGSEKENASVEGTWQETKELMKTMEGWVREIEAEMGDIEFEKINKRIKSDREVAESIEEKTRVWNQLKRCHYEGY